MMHDGVSVKWVPQASGADPFTASCLRCAVFNPVFAHVGSVCLCKRSRQQIFCVVAAMTSDVAMNLPSAPSTPTASVSSISDLTSTFEAVSTGSVSEQDSSPRTFTRRPRFSFDKQLIVNVRVRRRVLLS
jgi:hypothetical protein